jgi:glycine cleavage system H protein
MSNIPSDLKYTRDHEWVRISGTQATVGITDYAQRQLGDVVFCDLREVGTTVEREETCGTIESVKAVSELFAPLSGKITEVNEMMSDEPELLNNDPYGDGWLVRIESSDSAEVKSLLSAAEYEKALGED